MNLKPRLSPDGRLTEIAGGWRLSIPAGPEGRYRLAQLDDQLKVARRKYPWSPPARLELSARVSAALLPGTWGFGLWNDPYGFSFGPGDDFLRLPALPNCAWFFYSSPICHLSFRDDRPGNGFLAQVFASPHFHPRLLPAAALLPFSPRTTRRLLARVIREDGKRLDSPAAPAGYDVTHWHRYRLDWTKQHTSLSVDDARILETDWAPRAPLGLVIWIDNQHAAFTPQGKISFGMEANPEPAWLEIKDLDMS